MTSYNCHTKASSTTKTFYDYYFQSSCFSEYWKQIYPTAQKCGNYGLGSSGFGTELNALNAQSFSKKILVISYETLFWYEVIWNDNSIKTLNKTTSFLPVSRAVFKTDHIKTMWD